MFPINSAVFQNVSKLLDAGWGVPSVGSGEKHRCFSGWSFPAIMLCSKTQQGSLAEATVEGPRLSGRVAEGMQPRGHTGPSPSMAPRREAGGGLGSVSRVTAMLPRLRRPFVTRQAEKVLEISRRRCLSLMCSGVSLRGSGFYAADLHSAWLWQCR